MTYIDYLNHFNLWLESNALEASAQLMYFKLLNVFNRAGWPDTVQVDNRRMELMLGGVAKTTVIRARDRLIEAGLIRFRRGRRGSPNRYELVKEFSDATFCATYPATISATDSATENATPIKTKNKTKNKKGHTSAKGGREGVLDYEAYRQIFIQCCPSLPEPNEVREWTAGRKSALRARHVDLEAFREQCQRVERSDFLTGRLEGRNGHWRGCSLDWMLKAENWQKISEGNYDNRRRAENNGAKNTAPPPLLDDDDDYL